MAARVPAPRYAGGSTAAIDASGGATAGAWMWGPWGDLAAFGGSAAFALAFVALAPVVAPDGAVPTWAWVAFVLLIDVAHVWATLFRTYLDPEELRRRRAVYVGVPLACYAAGVALHAASDLAFWRVLAYVAVFHFVRQQVGWVAIYRARAGERSRIDRWLDSAVVYAATGWPLLVWHASPPRAFRWFIDGDFVDAQALAGFVRPLGVIYLALLVAYAARALERGISGARVNVGKHVVVVTTALTWYIGIVATNSDFQFTVANVVAHGIPYMALLWVYARERAPEVPGSPLAHLVVGGVAGFLGVAFVLAFAEEMAWDRLIWHDREHLFGGAGQAAPLLGPMARTLLVPLLAIPQATHYVLDALLWRRKDTGLAQARALGFAPTP